LRLYRSQYLAVDLLQVVLVKIALEFDVDQTALLALLVLLALLDLETYLHELQLQSQKQVVARLTESADLRKQLNGLANRVLYEGILDVGDL
jgi:hypothetical protein